MIEPKLYLLDTNFVSELRKPRPDLAALAFYEAVGDTSLFVSVLTIGELRRGAELKSRKDPLGGHALGRWIEQVERSFFDRMLGIDRDAADLWGRLAAQRPRPVVDTLIAATAIVHGMTLVTRNIDDVRDTGARLVNPWTGEEV